MISMTYHRHKNSFFPDSVTLWNDLGPKLRGAESLSIFKKNVLKLYRPVKRSLFNIHDPKCIKWIFQLRVGLSPLKSHKRRHNFQDTPDDTCHCTRDAETTHHSSIVPPLSNKGTTFLRRLFP